jgi:hypothetical protein
MPSILHSASASIARRRLSLLESLRPASPNLILPRTDRFGHSARS